jgi:hypothetical protein
MLPYLFVQFEHRPRIEIQTERVREVCFTIRPGGSGGRVAQDENKVTNVVANTGKPNRVETLVNVVNLGRPELSSVHRGRSRLVSRASHCGFRLVPSFQKSANTNRWQRGGRWRAENLSRATQVDPKLERRRRILVGQ